jgi:TetR/AcrR family tetracycline transcriptional repressor
VTLNRDRILSAAFGILDEYGLGDLSMRRLARTLDVAPGALYWHFPSKQELLGGIADRILDGETPGDVRTAAATVLDQLLGTRDGAEIVSAALASATVEHDPAVALSAALTGTASDPDLSGWVISRYLLGAAQDVQTALAAGVEPRPVADVLAGVDLIVAGATIGAHE